MCTIFAYMCTIYTYMCTIYAEILGLFCLHTRSLLALLRSPSRGCAALLYGYIHVRAQVFKKEKKKTRVPARKSLKSGKSLKKKNYIHVPARKSLKKKRTKSIYCYLRLYVTVS
jgi:hypothetical protein